MENRLEKVSRKWAASLGETFQANSLQLSYLLCVCVCVGVCACVCWCVYDMCLYRPVCWCVCALFVLCVCGPTQKWPNYPTQTSAQSAIAATAAKPQARPLCPYLPLSVHPLFLSLSLAVLCVAASFCWPFCRWPTAVLFGFVLFWSCGCHF